ncbi:MAG: uroporphyrinogen decarboxylase [Candidatus Zixiibacteriota bacterium]
MSHPSGGASKRDFIEVCYGRPVTRRPIWIMRQAGRYQASYRAVRERHTFEEVCRTPELACQVTLQPVREFDLDAAILFSDILVLLPPLGLPVRFEEGGPTITNPIADVGQVDRLRRFDPGRDVDFVPAAVRRIRAALPPSVPLIGFSGAPFTLACYAIEGTTSRDFTVARRFFHERPVAAQRLMTHLADAIADYLSAQIAAGADAVQMFDSWGGLLSPEDYREIVVPHYLTILERIRKPGVPVILYAGGTSHLLQPLVDVPFDVISVDWRTRLRTAATMCREATALQGNLDPTALFASREEIARRATAIMNEMDTTDKGHIFNLGHGILPDTPEEHLRALVEVVHGTPPKR